MKKKISLFTLLIFLGFIFSFVFSFKVKASDIPTIQLIGPDEITIQKGTPYKEFGATATDATDGDLTNSITISGSVDVNTVRKYTITYQVTDSDNNTVSKNRSISVVNNEITYKNVDKAYVSYHEHTRFIDVVDTNDGFMTVGSINKSSYGGYWPILIHADLNGDTIYSNDDYVYSDSERWNSIIKLSSGEYFTVGGYGTSAYGLLGNYNSSSFNKSYYRSYNTHFTLATELSSGNIAVFDQYNKYIYFFNESRTYISRFHVGLGLVSMISVDDEIITSTSNEIISFSYNGQINWRKNYSSVTINQILLNDSKIYVLGKHTNATNTELPVTNGGEDGLLLELDIQGNVLREQSFGGSKNDSFTKGIIKDEFLYTIHQSTSNDSILVNTQNGVTIIRLEDMTIINSHDNSSMLKESNAISVNNDGKIAVAGKGTNNFARMIIYEWYLFNGIENTKINYGDEFNVMAGIKLYDSKLNEVPFDVTLEGNVNTLVAGHHDVIYNFSYLTEEGHVYYRVKRRITVEPQINITNDAVYQGSITFNIKGGTFKVNEGEYTDGDIFNIPGNSALEFTGINGYTKTIPFSIELQHAGIINNYTYAEPVSLVFSGGIATLNGEEYTSGTVISKKGNHVIEISGANGFEEIINFKIVPTIIGVENDKTYFEIIYPNINAENMTLNGEVYNNEPIEGPGIYQLIINGTNGYVQTLNFIIETTVNGVVDNETYINNVLITFNNGTAKLNDEDFVSGTVVNNPGDNKLVIIGDNNYIKTINFVINPEIEGVESLGRYTPSLTPIISGGIITLNGDPYVSGTEINVPGNYTLVVKGKVSYSKTMYFTVLPEQINVVHGTTYYEPIVVATSNGVLTLNGNPYESGSTLNASGDYQFTVSGVGGYSQSINFSLNAGSNLEDGKDYELSKTIKFIGTATLNGAAIESGKVVDQVGNYQFVLSDGEFNETKNFRIVPNLEVYESPIYLEHTINIDNASLTLDGTTINSGHQIDEVGSYQLVITGVNGYTHTIDFDVMPRINVIDNNNYITSFDLEFEGGSYTLNGESVTENKTISTVGKYVLVVTGANGFNKTYNFNIIPEVLGIENEGLYIDSVVPTINHDDLLLDGNSYISGTEINAEGAHMITINGENGLAFEINFFIISNNLGVSEGEVFENTVTINSTLIMELNENPYTSGTPITNLGKNTIKLISGSSSKSITFYIVPTIEGVENGGIYLGEVTPNIQHGFLTLNSGPYTNLTTINQVGNHVIKLVNVGTGAHAFDYEIKFTVKEIITGVENQGQYRGAITPIIENATSLLLNGNDYTSNTIISNIGNHTLVVNGVNGYTNTIEFIILPQPIGVENDGEYTGSITPDIANASQLILNGQAYTNKTTIYTIGYHNLEIKGVNGYSQIINFTILPTISGVEAEGVYNSAITPNIPNALVLKLNGNYYTNNTQINVAGNYTLLIKGVNDYSKEISFIIHAQISNVEDGMTYNTQVTPNIKMAVEIQLNGQSFTNNTRINIAGNYTLLIKGVNDYSREVTFTINLVILNVENDATYNSSIAPNISFAKTMLLNGNQFSNNRIYEFGNHVLVITDVHDNVTIIKFTILPTLSGIADGQSYKPGSSSLSPRIDYAQKLELNGEEFSSGGSVKNIGHYTLKAYGIGEYEREYTFTILPTISNVEDGGVYTSSSIYINVYYPQSLLLNDEIFASGSYIYNVGNYTLVINGVGGFKQEISFVKKHNINLTEGSTYLDNKNINCYYAILYLNGEYIENGTTVKHYGNHQVRIDGVGNYSETINFVIEPHDIGITNEQAKPGAVAISKSYMTSFELNGSYSEDESLIAIEELGLFELKVFGLNGYEKVFNFTITPTILGFTNNNQYTSAVTINIANSQKLTLNDVEIENNHIVEEIGNYKVQVYVKNDVSWEYSFSIIPTNIGVENNKTYYDTININIPNAVRLVLNEKEVEKTSSVSIVGNYSLNIIGNNFEQTVNFRIRSHQFESYVETEAFEPISINIENALSLKLSDEDISNGHIINKMGRYTLTINGEGDYSESLTIILSYTLSGVRDEQDYKNIVIPVINNANILKLNGEDYTSGTPISLIGKYELEMIGEGDLSDKITFAILPTISGINDGFKGKEVIPVIIQDYSEEPAESIILIDDEEHVSNSVYSKVGHHTLKISGKGGYSSSITFTIESSMVGYQNNREFFDKQTFDIPNSIIKLNGEIKENQFTAHTIGHNTLEVIGSNNYSEIYTFTIIERMLNIENDATYQTLANPMIEGIAEFELNGKNIEQNSPILNVGYNRLKVIGVGGYSNEYRFTIIEKIQGIPLAPTNDTVTLSFSGIEEVLINGEVISTNTIYYTKAGNYNVLVKGSNGYSNSYSFKINLKINVYDSQVFREQHTIESNAYNIKLNDEDYDGRAVTTVGIHKIDVYDREGFRESVHFIIKPNVLGLDVSKTIYVGNSINVDGVVSMKLNGLSYVSGSEIKSIGNNVLEIFGINNYKEVVSFTVIENVVGLTNGEEKQAGFTFIILGNTVEVLLNNENIFGYFDSRYIINKIGNHTLTIRGLGGYSNEIEFQVNPKIIGVTEGANYDDNLEIKVEGDSQRILLNQTPTNSKIIVNESGHHDLIVIGENNYSKHIKFTVNPTIIGLEDNGIYSESRSFTINSKSLVKVNSYYLSEYNNEYTVSGFGVHKVEIIGVGGYVKEYNIAITYNLQNIIKPYDIYSVIRKDYFRRAKLFINGSEITAQYQFNQYGNYSITLEYDDIYTDTYDHTIDYDLITDNQKFNRYFDTLQHHSFGIDFMIKNKKITTRTYEVGNHILEVRGFNSYVKKIPITILEDINIQNNQVYESATDIKLGNIAKMYIDEKEIEGSFVYYSEIGNHTLKIVGEGEYEAVYNFQIVPSKPIEDNDISKKRVVIKTIEGEIYINGKLITKDALLTKSGQYNVEIKGANGYEESYSFEIKNDNEKMALIVGAPLAVLTVAGAIFFIIRRRRVI